MFTQYTYVQSKYIEILATFQDGVNEFFFLFCSRNLKIMVYSEYLALICERYRKIIILNNVLFKSFPQKKKKKKNNFFFFIIKLNLFGMKIFSNL